MTHTRKKGISEKKPRGGCEWQQVSNIKAGKEVFRKA